MTWKGQLFFEDKAEPEPRALPGSLVAFTRNGELQGVAYRRALMCIHERVDQHAVTIRLCQVKCCLKEGTPVAGYKGVPGWCGIFHAMHGVSAELSRHAVRVGTFSSSSCRKCFNKESACVQGHP